jgi:hypothetical protein
VADAADGSLTVRIRHARSADTPVQKLKPAAILVVAWQAPMKFTSLLLLAASAAIAAPAPAPEPTSKAPAKTAEASAAIPASAHGNADLAAARKELALLTARHGEKHHLVIKQRRKVAEMQKNIPASAPVEPGASATSELEAAKQDLAALRERYTDQHPLVKNKLARIAELEKR